MQPVIMQQDFQTSHWQALSAMWHQQLLCDVQLKSSSGETLPAHSIVLASASGFFRALLCGAGRSMREGCIAASKHPPQDGGGIELPTAHSSTCPHGQLVVDLPYTGQQLSRLLEVLYEHSLEVTSHDVSWLLDMSAYLEVAPLQQACCEFLREALSSDACVDVLLLAHHYHCTQLQAEAVLYLAKRLSGLLLIPDMRRALLRLPEPLLHQLLCSEAVDVSQESELLCFLADWVCDSPEDRQHHLHTLLPLLKLSALPEQQLSQQQLQGCSGPLAVGLAQRLYQASINCHHAQLQQQQGHRHLTQQQIWQQQQQQGSRRQAGQPVAAPSIGGQCLAWCSQGADGSSTDFMPTSTDSLHGGCDNPPAAAPCTAHCSSSSSCSMWWAPSASPDAANTSRAASCDPGFTMMPNTVCNSNAAMPSSSSGEGVRSCSSSGGSVDGLPSNLAELCDTIRMGDVVAQAWPGRQRGYQPTSILVAGGHDPSWRGLKAVEVYDPLTDTWRLGPMLPMALPFAGAGVATRSQVYVIGGAMCSNYMARLDVADEEWYTCEGPGLSRLHAGVTGSAGLLFITGGRTQVNVVVPAVEAYDHASAAWTSLPDMLQPRYAHALVAQGGCLYALGGQASKAIHRVVEVFDTHRGSWLALGAELISERKYCAASSLGGRLLVLGGMNEARRRLSTVEAYDPREGRWALLPGMQHARSSCSVASLGGRLYAMGGSAGNEQLHSSVEVFDPVAGLWTGCAALSCGRSGLTAAAV